MKELHRWFHENQRDFPWRVNPTPYKVWISEVMLQQTRASVVIPYFERWLTLFPDVKSLAVSRLEMVIKAWEGLGYYSRARNLHKGAQQIVTQFRGEIPANREELMQIRGLGPYTIGAILSFGFKKRAAAVDGNVTRVLARYFCIEENVCKQAGKRKIAQMAEQFLDAEEPWVTAEALIELGATVCTPKPRCEICCLQAHCQGQKLAASLSIKNSEKKVIPLKRAVIWLQVDGKVLVKKGEQGKVMADLYEFPYLEMGDNLWLQSQITQASEAHFGFKLQLIKKLPVVTHTFTKYKAKLYPFHYHAEFLQDVEGYQWINFHQLSELAFSDGHRKILLSRNE